MIAHGVWGGPFTYFRSGWRVLDALIVALSIAYLAVNSGPVSPGAPAMMHATP